MNLTDDVCMEKDDVYQMVETTAYFEAYRHVLEGLQKVRPDELPFQVAAVMFLLLLLLQQLWFDRLR